MAEANPILPAGRFGFDRTTKEASIGDGVTAWDSLPKIGVHEAPKDGKGYVMLNGDWARLSDDYVILIPPTITSADTGSAALGSTFTYQITGDTGGLTATYSATNLPSDAEINTATGLITWPVDTDSAFVGTHVITVGITTSAGTVTKNLTVTVTIPDSLKPTITSGQSLTLATGVAMDSYQIQGTNVTVTNN